MKKLLFICIFIFFIIVSLLYPSEIILASKHGILVWFEQILPALLPFTILSALLLKSNFLKSFSKGSNLLAIAATLSCGFIFGFPIGSKLAADFYKEHLLSKKQATVLAVTTNNFSPMYVCGYVLPLLFPNTDVLRSTYVLLYLIPLCMTACYLIFTYKTEQKQIEAHTDKSFVFTTSFLDDGIISGFQTLIRLCGYIVLFSILVKAIAIIGKPSSVFALFLLENMEITNGIQMLSERTFSTQTAYVMCIQLLSFGGLSGIAQTNSVFGTCGLSIYKYIIGKAALSLLLTLLTVIHVSYFIHLL